MAIAKNFIIELEITVNRKIHYLKKYHQTYKNRKKYRFAVLELSSSMSQAHVFYNHQEAHDVMLDLIDYPNAKVIAY